MVPHRKALQLIALLSLASYDREGTKDILCNELSVLFPCTLTEFLEAEVFKWLTPEIEVLLRTTDFKLVYDYRPLFYAAKQMEIGQYVGIGPDGPIPVLPPFMTKWRSNASLRIFVETSVLCEISAEQISEDIKLMYGVESIVAEDVAQFADLFVDRDQAVGDNWLSYAFCIGDGEAAFKRSLMGDPKDFVRWRLGVPVELDSDKVINRLCSDAYYELRLLKSGGNAMLTPTKEQMAREKLSHEIIFKCLDRRTKLKELANASGAGSGSTDAAREIQKIVLEFSDHNHQTKSEVNNGQEPSEPQSKPTVTRTLDGLNEGNSDAVE